MKTPKESEFILRKVKVTKSRGLHCEWEQASHESGVYDLQAYTRTSNDTPHMDALLCLDYMRQCMTEVCKITPGTPAFLTTAAFKGSDHNEAVMFAGQVVTDSGYPAAVSTPLIKFVEGVYGFEDQLRHVCKELKGEVFKYLFHGKRHDAEMPLTEGGEKPET